MGQRSRRRSRGHPADEPSARAPAPAPAPVAREKPAAYARSRARNDAVRAGLEPLDPGERPFWVTVAAVLAAVLAISNVVLALAGVEVQGEERSAVSFTILSTAILVACAAGMWWAKYWAVLGFQFVLGFQIVLLALALIVVESVWVGLAVAAAIVLFGALFWKLVRAMARIQMPDR